MADKKIELKPNKEVVVDGKQKAKVISIAGSWVAVKVGKDTKKVRRNQITLPGKAPKNTDTKVRLTPKVLAEERLLNPNMDHFVKGLGETKSGRDTVDIDDQTAKDLRGKDIKEVYNIVARKLADGDGFKDKAGKVHTSIKAIEAALHTAYDHLNLGMQRMNLGNRMRAANKAPAKKTTPAKKDAGKAKAPAKKAAPKKAAPKKAAPKKPAKKAAKK